MDIFTIYFAQNGISLNQATIGKMVKGQVLMKTIRLKTFLQENDFAVCCYMVGMDKLQLQFQERLLIMAISALYKKESGYSEVTEEQIEKIVQDIVSKNQG